MRNFTFLLIAAFMCSMVFSQVKMNSNGDVAIGNPTNASGKLCVDGVVRFKNWTSSRIDCTGECGAMCFYPEDDWNLHLGKSKTAGRVGKLHCHEVHYVNGCYKISDFQLKENIIRLENPLEKLKRISVYSYNLKSEFIGEVPAAFREKYSQRQIGFLAQELEREFPELVDRPDSLNEYYSVDYVSMVPILVEAIKEQQRTIETLQQETETLKEIVSACCNTTIQPKSVQIGNNNNDSYLQQNTPNPFSSETEIKYYVSPTSENAVIYVFNLQGTLKLQKPINQKGEGSVTISGSELEAGMYVYSLFINGKEIDSKKMLLTK